MWDNSNYPEVACSLISLIFLENNIQPSTENFEKILFATSIKIEKFWFSWFFTKVQSEGSFLSKQPESPSQTKNEKHIEKKGSEKVSEKEKSENEKEESDEDMGFGLFD